MKEVVVIAPGGAGIVVASMAGHGESPYEREIEHALATTPTDELLALPFLAPEQVGTSVHAYALAKRGNALRVETAAAACGQALRHPRRGRRRRRVPAQRAGRVHHRNRPADGRRRDLGTARRRTDDIALTAP